MAVGIFYKWEDHNHGLEHKCGTCATVLSSPRAKKTCFGVHEEVCPAYHKTLHFVGASHKCAACSNTTKAHNKRHLEIAEIIQAIHRLEGSCSTDSPLCNNKRKSKKKDIPNLDPSDDGSVRLGEIEQEPDIEWDSNSSTLNNDDDAEERRQCWSGAMESPDARKAAKAERKAAKNQVLFDVVTQEELALVDRALHPESDNQASTASKGQGLTDNCTIDENIAFTANTFRWGMLRQSVHAKKIAKNNGGRTKPNTEQDNKILSPIFAQLGISTNSSKGSRERKSLDAKLRSAILGDLVAFENDQVETMQRMAGYWRYANKRTYNEMVRNNEIWDWATGEKLPEIREAELDVIEEEDENADGEIQRTETEGRIPENWDDPDFELPLGDIALSLNPSAVRSNTNRRVGKSDALTKQSHADGDTNLDQEDQSIRGHISVSKLPSSPGHPLGQTLNFNVLPPVSSNKTWGQLRTDSTDHTKEDPRSLNASPAPRYPLSPMTSNRKGFQGVKDTRVFAKAIRNASPPFNETPPAPPPIQTLLAPAIQSRDTPDPLNRFGFLDREVPAPCDEVKKENPTPAKAVLRIPAKPIVKTLAIHDDDDEWQTMHHPKGKKRVKGGPAVALREQAAVNVHAKKFAGGKSFATVAKRG